MAQGRERRRDPRVHPKGVVAHVCALSRTFVCQVENLSAGGVFLRTDQILLAGTPLEMDLVKPGARKALHLSGTVVWTIEPEHAARQRATPGMGIEFAPPAPDQAERLQALLVRPGGPSESPVPAEVARATSLESPPDPAGASSSSAVQREELPLDPKSFEKAVHDGQWHVPPAALQASAKLAAPTCDAGVDSARLMTQIRGLIFELGELRGRLEQRETELQEALAELQRARDRIQLLERKQG